MKNSNSKIFYENDWFMWVMLICIPPVGVYLMWKYHTGMKKNNKVVLTVIFLMLFVLIVSSMNGTDASNTSRTSKLKQNKVKVVDFSTMTAADIDSWCIDNNIKCTISNEYSDTVEKDGFISQSIVSDKYVYEGEKISIKYSLGKKPSVEYLNALKKAESYSKTMYMSKQGIYDQLTSSYGEQFPSDAAQYAIDNMSADWNMNALNKAKSYQTTMNMSTSAIYDQLISSYGEKFTKEEAQYAIDHLND